MAAQVAIKSVREISSSFFELEATCPGQCTTNGAAARALLESQQNIGIADRDRLFGYVEGGGKVILPEPQPLLTKASKVPGLDGQKMSKSYGNTISLRADPDMLSQQLRKMPTDPARVRRTDPGNPDLCPVWQFHQVYSDQAVQQWVQNGCRSAGIGCIECKGPVIDAVLAEIEIPDPGDDWREAMRRRAAPSTTRLKASASKVSTMCASAG